MTVDFGKLSFCESATASSLALWHLRELGLVGKKPSGGIDTASFCGRVRPVGVDADQRIGFGGWDIDVGVDLQMCDFMVKLPPERPGRLCESCYGALLHKIGEP